jgi:hypothetical protein
MAAAADGRQGSAGALTFVDGEPLYTSRGPAVMAEEQRIKSGMARQPLRLLEALGFDCSDEANLRAFEDGFCDETAGECALFDP